MLPERVLGGIMTEVPLSPFTSQVIVVGAGAAGMMAAGRAAESGADVLLLEKMKSAGRKVSITGKTRCNISNTAELDDFILRYGKNGPFLYSAFKRYFRDDLLELLACHGVQVKAERGGRIFPASDNADDVVKVLTHYVKICGAHLKTGSAVTGIAVEGDCITGVRVGDILYPARAVILAAGGASYPVTGSSGDGYRLAASLGHTIVPLRPALVPLLVEEKEIAASMQGVSLRNVRLTSYRGKPEDVPFDSTSPADTGRGIAGRRPRHPVIESRMGEMMFTHFGIGGPVTLQMSLAVVDALKKGPVSIAIDLKPALTITQLRQRLQRDFDLYSNRSYRNLLKELLPQKMVAPFIAMTGIAADKPGHQITAGEREILLRLLKSLRFAIKGALPLSSAMVTAGGVSLKEIDPRTMASRLIKGLYFCGEVMDIDAETGGFNLQAAFSTGYVAGENAAAFVKTLF